MILTDMHFFILAALAPEPAGLGTSELAERLRPGSATTMPRGEFGRCAADFGVPLGELVRSGLVHRGAMHAGWRITTAGVRVDDLANAEAGGSEDFSPAIWESLSRLYRRPIAWLRGDLMPPVEISPELHELMESKKLSDADRREVVAFAEWLQQRKAT